MNKKEKAWVKQIDATIETLTELKRRIKKGKVSDVKCYTEEDLIRAMVKSTVHGVALAPELGGNAREIADLVESQLQQRADNDQ